MRPKVASGTFCPNFPQRAGGLVLLQVGTVFVTPTEGL